MRIRREEHRRKAEEVARVTIDRGEPGSHEPVVESRRATKDWPNVEPRDRPEPDFKAAGPIDANLRRVGLEPFAQQSRGARRIARVPGESVRLRQGDDETVAVELPDDLVIADGLPIERIDPAEVNERRPPAVQRIEVPVHGSAEVKLSESEDLEPSFANPIRTPYQSVRCHRVELGRGTRSRGPVQKTGHKHSPGRRRR
jgi:hypothetical protein